MKFLLAGGGGLIFLFAALASILFLWFVGQTSRRFDQIFVFSRMQHRIPLEAIPTIPSAFRRVVRLSMTTTITNQFRKKYRTTGIKEGAIGTKIAIIAVHAITTIPSALLRVNRLAITSTITNMSHPFHHSQ
jgi:hypothetical protein